MTCYFILFCFFCVFSIHKHKLQELKKGQIQNTWYPTVKKPNCEVLHIKLDKKKHKKHTKKQSKI